MKSAKEMDGATICVQPGTTTELRSTTTSALNKMKFTPILIEDLSELQGAFLSGRCDAYSTDASALATFRFSQGPKAQDSCCCPEIISKEPLGVMVRKGDDKWFDLVRWTFIAMITAEEKGITSQNVDSFMDSKDPDIRRLLGLEGDMGKALGLDNKWAYNVIKQVGNSARCGTAISRRWACSAASTSSGRRAGCNTRRRSADVATQRHGRGEGRRSRPGRGGTRACPVLPPTRAWSERAPRRRRPLRLSWSDPVFARIVWQVVIVGFVGADRLVSGRQYRPEPGGPAHRHRLRPSCSASPASRSVNRRSHYNPAVDTYGTALIIGILNTLRVAAVGIVLATILGTLIGIGRLSGNWLLAKLTAFYVETLRDIPLLLQLFFWYSILQTLPPPRQAWHIGSAVFLSNRGAKVAELDRGSPHIPGHLPPSSWASSAHCLEPRRALATEATGVRPSGLAGGAAADDRSAGRRLGAARRAARVRLCRRCAASTSRAAAR